MPTNHPRVNVVLDPPTHALLKKLARRQGASLSAEARRLLEEALELEEDRALAAWAAERERGFSRRTALTHDQVWRTGRS